jgi:hypothetical protein
LRFNEDADASSRVQAGEAASLEQATGNRGMEDFFHPPFFCIRRRDFVVFHFLPWRLHIHAEIGQPLIFEGKMLYT